jgi:predicted permease
MNWRRRLLNIFRRGRIDTDIDQEFQFHLAQSIDNLIAAGMSEEEARQTARRQFGNYTLHKESAHKIAAPLLIGDLLRDLRYGVRQLRHNPGFTIVAALALGIGVGADITIFGFVSALLLRPLDVNRPDELVRILGEGGSTQQALATNSEAHIPAEDYLQYRDRNQSFSDLAAQSIGGPARVRIDGPPQIIPTMLVSGNYFTTIGVPAAIGRTLAPEDAKPGAAEVIVLSDAGWHRFFGADRGVIGKTVFINGTPRTVVGITPDWFKGTLSPMVPQIYAPKIEGASPFRVDLLGRLKPGVSPAQARADLSRIAAQLTTQDRQRRGIEIYPAKVLVPVLFRPFSLFATVFVVIVTVVLMIVCDNIAILILARSAARRREIGIRLALGASRSRLLPQLLVESLLLCAAGGVIGMYLAYVTARFVTQIYLPVPMPFALTFNFDWRVVLFAVGTCFVTTLFCGLAPALQSLRLDVLSALKGEGQADGSRVRSRLIVSQMTLSTTLLITAAVLTHSVMLPVDQDRGFVSDGVLLSTINIGAPGYTPQRRLTFLQTLLQRVEREPGVVSATIVDNIPLANNNPIDPTELQSGGRTERVYLNHISRGLFQTLNIPLLAGRDFNMADTATTTGVGIVNETLARHFWPGENPIGKRLQSTDGSPIEVVGLARNSKYEAIDESEKPFLYRPMTQDPILLPTFLIKATGDPSTILSAVRTRIAEMDPELVPYNVITFNDRLGLSTLMHRAVASVSGSLGLLALALSAIGIYGTMSFLVQLRRREIGIRMALGASPWSVVKLVTNQGMIWTATGLALGVIGGLGATLLLSRFLYGVVVTDPFAFILALLTLGGSAYLACYLPARRATRVDSLALLRDE